MKSTDVASFAGFAGLCACSVVYFFGGEYLGPRFMHVLAPKHHNHPFPLIPLQMGFRCPLQIDDAAATPADQKTEV